MTKVPKGKKNPHRRNQQQSINDLSNSILRLDVQTSIAFRVEKKASNIMRFEFSIARSMSQYPFPKSTSLDVEMHPNAPKQTPKIKIKIEYTKIKEKKFSKIEEETDRF